MGPLSLRTDGGGSIRVPCAPAGLLGLKPTFGQVAQFPAGAFGTMPYVRPIARTAADAATNGLPVGIRLIGPLDGGALVLRARHAFECARPIVDPEQVA